MILSTLTQLQQEISAVAERIKKNFETKSYYYGFQAPSLTKIKDILNSYLYFLSNGEIKPFNSTDGKGAEKIVNKIIGATRYGKEEIYFTLYELESLAKEGMMTAQKILNFNLTKESDDFGGIFFPKKPELFADIKQVLLYALIILALIYFAPVISQLLKQFTSEK